ncbi:hypothetical protein J6590_083006 [Homalodisca vitripennis]|nr:hypothetical protein J6590_083006 [Homalodisca vitripennis]
MRAGLSLEWIVCNDWCIFSHVCPWYRPLGDSVIHILFGLREEVHYTNNRGTDKIFLSKLSMSSSRIPMSMDSAQYEVTAAGTYGVTNSPRSWRVGCAFVQSGWILTNVNNVISDGNVLDHRRESLCSTERASAAH